MKIEVLYENPDECIGKYPIVFVHGGYMGAWCWKPYFIPYMKQKGFECYALSLRGHGNSEGHDMIQKHSFGDYVEDVEQLLNGIGRKCILVGHSMGGAVVQKVCEANKDKIAAMILLCSPSPMGMGIKAGIEMMGRGVKQVWNVTMFHQGIIKSEDIPEKFPFRWFFSDYMNQDEKIKYARMMTRESDKVSKQITKKFIKKPEDFKMPILIVGGGDDWYFSPKTQTKNAVLYGTEAVIVPKIAHNVMIDKNWDKVAEKVYQFIVKIQ